MPTATAVVTDELDRAVASWRRSQVFQYPPSPADAESPHGWVAAVAATVEVHEGRLLELVETAEPLVAAHALLALAEGGSDLVPVAVAAVGRRSERVPLLLGSFLLRKPLSRLPTELSLK